MAPMTDPFSALTSFQLALQCGGISLSPGVSDAKLYAHVDYPGDKPRITYVRLEGLTVTALAMFVKVEDHCGHPCFQLGYAVPCGYRGQGRGKEIVNAALQELKAWGIGHSNGVIFVEAVVGADNPFSQKISASCLSATPDQITDGPSGEPALHYVLRIDESFES